MSGSTVVLKPGVRASNRGRPLGPGESGMFARMGDGFLAIGWVGGYALILLLFRLLKRIESGRSRRIA